MGFDLLAPHYRWMEAILAGNVLQRCRTHWLPMVRRARNALLVGEGNGRMLEACAGALPDCQITVLDKSEAMIKQARRRWRRIRSCASVEFQAVDLRNWSADGAAFDLVVSNFFLDCFAPDELSGVVANICFATKPGTIWLLSDFTLPPAGWKRMRARAVLALAYGFFRTVTDISARRITPPDSRLQAAGFVLRGRERFNQDLLQADWWLREV